MPNAIGTSAIGHGFGAEIIAAGLSGASFTWGSDGDFSWGVGLSDSTKSAVLAVFAAHDPTNMKAELQAYAGSKLDKLRDGGITVNVGTASAPQIVDVASDADGRSLVTGAVQLIGLASQTGQAAPSFPWVNNDGSKLSLTGAQMMTIGYALGAYVQAAYATFGDVLAAIAGGTTTTIVGIDAAAWPATAR